MNTPLFDQIFPDPPLRGHKAPKRSEQIGAREIRFDGPAYVSEVDDQRLTGQILRVFNAMKDGKFRTLSEIEVLTGDPQASVSAQLRHLRKVRFGGHTVNRRNRGDRTRGLFEYQLIPRG